MSELGSEVQDFLRALLILAEGSRDLKAILYCFLFAPPKRDFFAFLI